jgi:hypothetical protein
MVLGGNYTRLLTRVGVLLSVYRAVMQSVMLGPLLPVMILRRVFWIVRIRTLVVGRVFKRRIYNRALIGIRRLGSIRNGFVVGLIGGEIIGWCFRHIGAMNTK